MMFRCFPAHGSSILYDSGFYEALLAGLIPCMRAIMITTAYAYVTGTQMVYGCGRCVTETYVEQQHEGNGWQVSPEYISLADTIEPRGATQDDHDYQSPQPQTLLSF
jgi:hypothetical protein